VANNEVIKRVRDLSELRRLLTQDESGCEVYLYSQLAFGDVWWIPDALTGLSINKMRHPWVIVKGYTSRVASVIVCPRTTTLKSNDIKRGILTPANILPGLDKEGLFLLNHRRTFSTTIFRDLEYIGKLPESTCDKIRDFIKVLAEGRIRL
jgi:mRNA-degrading endonuclease toxin of MazEF toxin-antitoxin module